MNGASWRPKLFQQCTKVSIDLVKGKESVGGAASLANGVKNKEWLVDRSFIAAAPRA
jgi:hypothetical protein